MSKRLIYLKQRRALLVSQAAVQRSELPFITQDLQQHLRLVDMSLAIVSVIRKHPALTLASASLLFPARQNRMITWSRRLFTSWEVFALVRKQWRNAR
ncbi:MAG: YqjK family protein [Gammaproteobacteria bacterium]|jgi:hypothetical protein|nr:YqjK family protein [Gammaproteobacteria bacterium]